MNDEWVEEWQTTIAPWMTFVVDSVVRMSSFTFDCRAKSILVNDIIQTISICHNAKCLRLLKQIPVCHRNYYCIQLPLQYSRTKVYLYELMQSTGTVANGATIRRRITH
jgi:hypothetical protein